MVGAKRHGEKAVDGADALVIQGGKAVIYGQCGNHDITAAGQGERRCATRRWRVS